MAAASRLWMLIVVGAVLVAGMPVRAQDTKENPRHKRTGPINEIGVSTLKTTIGSGTHQGALIAPQAPKEARTFSYTKEQFKIPEDAKFLSAWIVPLHNIASYEDLKLASAYPSPDENNIKLDLQAGEGKNVQVQVIIYALWAK